MTYYTVTILGTRSGVIKNKINNFHSQPEREKGKQNNKRKGQVDRKQKLEGIMG